MSQEKMSQEKMSHEKTKFTYKTLAAWLFAPVFVYVGSCYAVDEPPLIDKGQPKILSAFFGLDDGAPSGSPNVYVNLCGVDGMIDGMPLVINHEINQHTLNETDFKVIDSNGVEYEVECASLWPAQDEDEDRTILLSGNFGSEEFPPVRVEVVGNVHTEVDTTGRIYNLKGISTNDVTPLASGPFLVISERVYSVATNGGEAECPASTRQIIRLIWSGGITQWVDPQAPGSENIFPPGAGEELSTEQYARIEVTVADRAGKTRVVHPFYIGDRDDGDNNNELCLDTVDTAVSIKVLANTVTDPNNDFNDETEVMVWPVRLP